MDQTQEAQGKKPKSKTMLLIILAVLLIVAGVAAFFIFRPNEEFEDDDDDRRPSAKRSSMEAQTAIAAIRKTYDVYRQTNGSTQDFTIERAMKEINLGESTVRNWKFEVTGNPPKKFIATSTSDNPAGEGKQVWYDVDEARFHGYGVDSYTDPNYEGSEGERPSERRDSRSRSSAYVMKSRSGEAQTAIAAIRKTYDVYRQTYGSTQDYSIERALKETNLGESTIKHWKFETTGNPPRIYLATSTADFPGGAGEQVWYDVDEAKFHGYGVDGQYFSY